MDVDLSDAERTWQQRSRALALSWPDPPVTSDVMASATAAGLLAADLSLLQAVLAAERLGEESAVGAVVYALNAAVRRAAALPMDGRSAAAVALSSDELPRAIDGRLVGRACWVSPATVEGPLLVGAVKDGETVACLTSFSEAGVSVDRINAAGLHGLACAHVRFDGTPFTELGSPKPVMTEVRLLLAAAGLGLGRRALREALRAAPAYGRRGAAGEQTVQGLLADAATELDAATLLARYAALAVPPTLGQASMAKFAATESAQRAVERATQVVGAESFTRGHILEQLAQDVRALELFAGRTEALRDAMAEELLPQSAA